MIWARASVLGLAVLGVGTTSHLAADGLLPSWPVLAVLFLACTALSAPLLRGPAGPLRIVALLVGGQALTHLALSAAAGHTGPTAYASTTPGSSPATAPNTALRAELVDGRRVGSLMDQSLSPVLDTAHGAGPGALDHLLAHVLAGGPWMLLAHTAAAVALGLWLALGEAALWGLLVAVAVSCRNTLALPLAGAVRPLIPVARDKARIPLLPVPLPDPLHLRVPTRRGPPVPLGT